MKQQPVKQIYAPDIELRANQYTGTFYKRTKNGNWRKFETIGNTGVAEQFGNMLQRLGFCVTVRYYETSTTSNT